jgi:hypothetical protein
MSETHRELKNPGMGYAKREMLPWEAPAHPFASSYAFNRLPQCRTPHRAGATCEVAGAAAVPIASTSAPFGRRGDARVRGTAASKRPRGNPWAAANGWGHVSSIH